MNSESPLPPVSDDRVADDELASVGRWIALGSGVSLLLFAVMRGSRVWRIVLTLTGMGWVTRAAIGRDGVRSGVRPT